MDSYLSRFDVPTPQTFVPASIFLHSPFPFLGMPALNLHREVSPVLLELFLIEWFIVAAPDILINGNHIGLSPFEALSSRLAHVRFWFIRLVASIG